MANERDEFERMAEYYDAQILVELKNTLKTLQEIVAAVEGGRPYTYAQNLNVAHGFTCVKDAMHARDKFGTHSKTGFDRFRQIAHPEQSPAPAEKEKISPV
jgi:hypothetical protein